MSSDSEEIVWQGKFITTKTRGKWEYVSRARGIKAAVILAIEAGTSSLLSNTASRLAATALNYLRA